MAGEKDQPPERPNKDMPVLEYATGTLAITGGGYTVEHVLGLIGGASEVAKDGTVSQSFRRPPSSPRPEVTEADREAMRGIE